MDGEWTYQLEVVLHGFTPEGTSASIREVGDYQTIYTGFFGGSSEFSQPPPDDGVDVGEEHHRARQLRRHLLEHRQHTVCRRAARQRARRRCLKIICPSRVWTRYFTRLCIIISSICVIFFDEFRQLFYCGLHEFFTKLWFALDMFPIKI